MNMPVCVVFVKTLCVYNIYVYIKKVYNNDGKPLHTSPKILIGSMCNVMVFFLQGLFKVHVNLTHVVWILPNQKSQPRRRVLRNTISLSQ